MSRQLLDRAGPVQLLAVAISGQAPTLVAVDADLLPTHPAITWLDKRQATEAERLYALLGQSVPTWGSWPAQVAWFAHERPAASRQLDVTARRKVQAAPTRTISTVIVLPFTS